MSIRVMNRVWEHSQHKEGTLLVLLALADYADDNGVCWPAQPEIASKARLTDRQIRNVLKGLVDDGELLFVPSKGRGRPAIYCVLTGLAQDECDKRRKWFQGKYFQENTSALTEERRKLATEKAEIGDRKGGNQLHTKYHENSATESDEPPIIQNDNRHDPSLDPSMSVSGVDKTPALALAIAEVCKINTVAATRKQRAGLNETYTALRSLGATPDDVKVREVWWYANDWRAKKENRPPRPEELREVWDMVKVKIKPAHGDPISLAAHAPAPKPLPSREDAERARQATKDLRPLRK